MRSMASFILISLDGFYEGPNGEPAYQRHKEKLVFSRTLTDAHWSKTTLMRGEATEHVARLKAAPGREVLLLGSAHLTANLAQAGSPRRTSSHDLPGRARPGASLAAVMTIWRITSVWRACRAKTLGR